MTLDQFFIPNLFQPLTLALLGGVVLLLAILLLVVLLKPGRREIGAVAVAVTVTNERVERLERMLHADAAETRGEAEQRSRALREEIGGSIRGLGDSLQGNVGSLARVTQERLDRLTETTALQLTALRDAVDTKLSTAIERAQADGVLARSEAAQQLDAIRQTLATQIERLREENARKLEDMRSTVDEKLQRTLEQRLGESFKLVSDQLNSVYLGLGEMRQVAGDVGDLKRVLSNVKTRGGWAEVQLDAMLEQFLHPDQFVRNAAIRPHTSERVEFAIRLPNKDEDATDVLLPIDAKFPKEDYERLCDALERAELDAVHSHGRALEERFRVEARRIRDKYIDPPTTTDFAVLFVPTEGLYAEIARRPGLLTELQGELRVMVAGPSTLGALLNSLQLGFRTLALSKRSSEVWDLLRAAKTEFGRFGEAIEKVRVNIDRAGKSLEAVGNRSRGISRVLRNVETLPDRDAEQMLDPSSAPDSTGTGPDRREEQPQNANGGAVAPPS